jgi:hypothetical protein
MISPVEHFPYSTIAIYQDMSWCRKCAGDRIFLEVYEFEGGRVGYCVGCGDERIAPFTRANSEAA